MNKYVFIIIKKPYLHNKYRKIKILINLHIKKKINPKITKINLSRILKIKKN